MKYVRTRLGHEAVVLGGGDEAVTLNRAAVKVSNEKADEYEKAAARVGVRLTITDADDDEPDSGPVVTPSPDLSNGVAAVTGQGDPVTTDDANPGADDTPAATGRTRKDR